MKNKFLNYTFICFTFLNNIINATNNTTGQKLETLPVIVKEIEKTINVIIEWKALVK